jgi:hypothetical protein
MSRQRIFDSIWMHNNVHINNFTFYVVVVLKNSDSKRIVVAS